MTKLSAPTVLKKIIERKREEVAALLRQESLASVQHRAEQAGPVRGFIPALQRQVAEGNPAVIAEIKKASPSKGVIREHFDPVQIAQSYERGGAACLSVLTDRDFFQGADDYLVAARNTCSLPVIRKDFTVDPFQIWEARALGADAILLIVACLESSELRDLYACSQAAGVDALVEVHDADELEEALALGVQMVGINNRDLHTFETRLETTLELLGQIPPEVQVVTESGIHTGADVMKMRTAGVHTFLVGEAFMRADEPGHKLAEMFDLNRSLGR